MSAINQINHKLAIDNFAIEAVQEFDSALKILALASIEPRVLPFAIMPAIAEAIAVIRMDLEVIRAENDKSKSIIT